jgi:predicted nucleic acid-binding protein
MSQYLLDTTPLASFLLGRAGAHRLITPWTQYRAVVTSILAYGEAIEYLKGFTDFPRHHIALRRLTVAIKPSLLTYAILDRYADIRRALRPPHDPGVIGDMDTLIAATAREYNLTLRYQRSAFPAYTGAVRHAH